MAQFQAARRSGVRDADHAAGAGARPIRRRHQSNRGVCVRGSAKDAKGNEKPLEHEEYCWMNSAYVMGARLTEAFSKNGWCTAIRGAENGGKVEGLPSHIFKTDDGDTDMNADRNRHRPRREYELSDCGFLSLVDSKNSDFAVFIGSQTTKKPTKYTTPDATENAQIASRLRTLWRPRASHIF